MITLHADSNFNKSKIDKLVGENELLVSSIFILYRGKDLIPDALPYSFV